MLIYNKIELFYTTMSRVVTKYTNVKNDSNP